MQIGREVFFPIRICREDGDYVGSFRPPSHRRSRKGELFRGIYTKTIGRVFGSRLVVALVVMAHFSQGLLLGRAVLGCEQPHLLEKDPLEFATTSRGAAAAPEESYKLYFPHICGDDYVEEWKGRRDVTALIVLEGLKRDVTCSLLAFPCGVLSFHCSRERRDDILCSAEFSNEDLMKGTVRVLWLTGDTVCKMHDCLMVSRENNFYTWRDLWSVAHATVVCEKSNENPMPLSRRTFRLDDWSLQNLIKTWTEKLGCWNSTKNLTSLEYVWLYFHVALRRRRDTNVESAGMLRVLRELGPSLGGYSAEDEDLCEENVTANGKIVRTCHGMMARLTGNYGLLTDDLLAKYERLCDTVKENRELVTKTLTDAMQESRHVFSSFPLYTSFCLKTFTEDSICTVPLSVFDTTAIAEWSEHRRDVLRRDVLNPEKVYRSIYENAKPFFRDSNGGEFLRLYGNLDGYVTRLTGTPTKLEYRVERLGALSTGAVSALPLYGASLRLSRCFRTSDASSSAALRLAESSDFCTPVWANPTQTAMSFVRIVPVLSDGKRKRCDEPGNGNGKYDTMENLIERYMYDFRVDHDDDDTGDAHGGRNNHLLYSSLSPSMATTNEYLQSGLHWSSFVADIDLDTSDLDVRATARDAVKIFDDVFETLFDGFAVRRHLVFASAIDDDDDDGGGASPRKTGLHHHALLPPGLVFTSSACRDVAGILETVRRLYPNTIGRCEKAYDVAIYPSTNSTKTRRDKGHCLRGPFQYKFNGKRQLRCVFDSWSRDETAARITAEDVLIHGPQRTEDSRERILFGRVVRGIVDVRALTDVEFFREYEASVMTGNMESTCRLGVGEICAEINKKCVIFPPNKNNHVTLLLSLVNDLWTTCGGRAKMVERMKKLVGRAGKRYCSTIVNNVKRRSSFVYDSVHGTINLALNGSGTACLPFCPARPHNKSDCTSDVRVKLGYSARMIRFVLFVTGCFKASCRNPGSGFIPDVHLVMPNVFLCPSLQRRVQRYMSQYLRGPRVRVQSIEKHEDDEDFVVRDVVHDSRGVYAFIKDSSDICKSVRRLFMFVDRRVLVFSPVGSMQCLACIGTSNPEVYVARDSALLVYYMERERLLEDEKLLHLLKKVTDDDDADDDADDDSVQEA